MCVRIAILANHFKVYEYQHYRADSGFLDEVKELVRSSYFNTSTLLERERSHNEMIYFTRDSNDMLSSLFMTNYDIVDNSIMNYMGLLAVADKYKNGNLTAPLLLRHIQNVQKLEKEI